MSTGSCKENHKDQNHPSSSIDLQEGTKPSTHSTKSKMISSTLTESPQQKKKEEVSAKRK